MQGEIGINELAQDVTGKAQGVFIWVRLVIDELCQGLTDGTPITMLREVLKNIPHELEDLYARALGKVRREYAAEAHILLHMVLGSLSTLHIQTLLDCASWLLVGMTDAQNLKSQASRLASRTGGLLEVVNSNGSSIVQFIHQTAKEYIRSYGDRLRLKYPDSVFDSSSPLYSFTNDGSELQCIEGPQLLLLCGVQGQSFSESIIPHIFAYAKEVDNKLPSLVGMKRAALDSLNQLLNNENLWQRCSAYASLKSFTAGPSLVELAIAANWRNMIRECFTSDGDMTGAAHLAALGPSILDDCTDRIGMVKTLIDGYRQPGRSSYDPFQLSMHATQPRGLRRAQQLEFPLDSSERRTRMIGVSERRRMLKSVDAVADDIKDETALLTTLISIKSHPFVSELEIIEIATSLLENDAEPLIGEDTTITLRIGDGRIVYFRSALSFCLHLRSVEWVNIFLKKTRQSIRPSQSLAHCLASGRDSANPTLRADFLWKAFGKVEEELCPILDDEGENFGVGWPLAWLGSQCGIVGFPHINRSFCSSEDH